MRRVPMGLAGALLAGVAAAAPLAAQRADGFRVRPLDGAVQPLVATTPAAPRLVNVWAPWCGPCVEELPSLEALADSLRADGVHVLTLSGAREASVRRFLAATPVRLPVLLEQDEVPEAWAVAMLPTTVLLDADGRVLRQWRGARRWNAASMVAELRSLVHGSVAMGLDTEARPAEGRP